MSPGSWIEELVACTLSAKNKSIIAAGTATLAHQCIIDIAVVVVVVVDIIRRAAGSFSAASSRSILRFNLFMAVGFSKMDSPPGRLLTPLDKRTAEGKGGMFHRPLITTLSLMLTPWQSVVDETEDVVDVRK